MRAFGVRRACRGIVTLVGQDWGGLIGLPQSRLRLPESFRPPHRRRTPGAAHWATSRCPRSGGPFPGKSFSPRHDRRPGPVLRVRPCCPPNDPTTIPRRPTTLAVRPNTLLQMPTGARCPGLVSDICRTTPALSLKATVGRVESAVRQHNSDDRLRLSDSGPDHSARWAANLSPTRMRGAHVSTIGSSRNAGQLSYRGVPAEELAEAIRAKVLGALITPTYDRETCPSRSSGFVRWVKPSSPSRCMSYVSARAIATHFAVAAEGPRLLDSGEARRRC